MGDTIVKIAPDRDQYVIWSSITETPHWLGNAAELLDQLGGRCTLCQHPTGLSDLARTRIARADKNGSSSHHGEWWWEYEGEPYQAIYAQLGLVARDDLPAIVELLAGGAPIDDERIRIRLEPFEDEDEAVPDGR